MNDDAITRRFFLSLCSGGITGIWLAGTGLVPLPAQMVFAMSGLCSFCGKEAREVFALAGMIGRRARVCDECIDLCLDILAEEEHLNPSAPTEIPDDAAAERFSVDWALVNERLSQIAAGEPGDPAVDALAELLNYSDYDVKPQTEALSCSFCDKRQQDLAYLIAGPSVNICNRCIGNARELLMRYGWRKS